MAEASESRTSGEYEEDELFVEGVPLGENESRQKESTSESGGVEDERSASFSRDVPFTALRARQHEVHRIRLLEEQAQAHPEDSTGSTKRGRSLLTDASNDYRRPHLHMSSDEGETGEHQDRLRFHSVEAKLRKAMHQSRSGPSGSGEDVIEKMQEAKRESAPPVVYLTYAKDNHDNNPFFLEAIPERSVGDEFFAVTRNGITYLKKGEPSWFLTLEQWLRQRALNIGLQGIPFLGRHSEVKVFHHWRANAKRTAFEEAREMVSSRLLILQQGIGDAIRSTIERLEGLADEESSVLKLSDSTHHLSTEYQQGCTSALSTLLGDVTDEVPKTYYDRLTVQSKAEEQASRLLREATKESCSEVAELAQEHDSMRERSRSSYTRKQLRSMRFTVFKGRRWAPKSFDTPSEVEKQRLERADEISAHEHSRDQLSRLAKTIDLIILDYVLRIYNRTLDLYANSVLHPRRGGDICIRGTMPSIEDDDERDEPRLSPSEMECRKLYTDYLTRVRSVFLETVRPLDFGSLHNTMKLYGFQGHIPLSSFLHEFGRFDTAFKTISEKVDEDFNSLKQLEAYSAFKQIKTKAAFATYWTPELYNQYSPTASDFSKDLQAVKEWTHELEEVTTTASVGVFNLDTTSARDSFLPYAQRCLEQMKTMIIDIHTSHCERLITRLTEYKDSFQTHGGLEDFVTLLRTLASHLEGGSAYDEIRSLMLAHWTFVEEEGKMKKGDVDTESWSFLQHNIFKVDNLYEEYLEARDQAIHFRDAMLHVYKDSLDQEVKKLQSDIYVLKNKLYQETVLSYYQEASDAQHTLKTEVETPLAECRSRMAELESWRQIMGLADIRLPREELETAQRVHDARNEMWVHIEKWRKFVKKVEQVNLIEGENLQQGDLSRSLNYLEKALNLVTTSEENATGAEKSLQNRIQAEMDEWRPYVKIFPTLCADTLNSQHWGEVLTRLGHQNVEKVSLRDVLNDETLSNTEIIKEVTKRADESKFISRDIQAVKGEFQDLVLRFDENRIRGVRTLVNLESLLGEVRTCQKTLNSFLDRPQILDVMAHFESIESVLLQAENTLASAKECQTWWLFLSSIVSDKEVRLSAPQAASRFDELHTHWVLALSRAQEQKTVERCASQDGALSTCAHISEGFAGVWELLRPYAEEARQSSPRLLLLSDKEILELVSVGNSFEAFPKGLFQKCFPGLATLLVEDTFSGASKAITGVQGPNGEEVYFDAPLYSGAFKGVKDWIQILDDSIKDAVKEYTRRCMRQFLSKDLRSLLEAFPGQTLLLADQVSFTRAIDNAVSHGTSTEEIAKLVSRIEQRILHLRDLIEELPGKFPVISALLTASLFYRNCCEEAASAYNEWEELEASEWLNQWQDQPRFYSKDDGEEVTVWMHAGDRAIVCNHEYIGDGDLLSSAANCMKLSFRAGAILTAFDSQGSFVVFGSEANEQCKSLAAACGSIFIRSCRLSTQTLLERFLDCASRLGAMVFFEGVERFSPSLLRSLISQLKKRSVDRKGGQTTAKASHEGKVIMASSSGYDDEELRSCFPLNDLHLPVTVSAAQRWGRAAIIPSELKENYRPLALVSHREVAAFAAQLYCRGMENAQRAADCLVALTMELRATLAGTKHYMLQYYVLREALQGLVLHKMDPNDQWKMLKSQMELRILSSLQAEDRHLAQQRLDACFEPYMSSVSTEPTEFLDEKAALKEWLAEGEVVSPSVVEKVDQISKCLFQTLGMIVIGAPGCGKSSLISLAIEWASYRHDGNDLKVVRSYPGSFPESDDTKTMESSLHFGDGSRCLQGLIKSIADHDVIILDGKLHSEITDSFDLLFDKDKLFLALKNETETNENKVLSGKSIVTELADASMMTPALWSKCAVVYVDQSEGITAEGLVPRAIRRLSNQFSQIGHKELYNLLESIRMMIVYRCDELAPVGESSLVATFCNRVVDFGEALIKTLSGNPEHKVIEIGLLLATAWTVGGGLSGETRERWERYFWRSWTAHVEEGASAFTNEEFTQSVCIDSVFSLWPSEDATYLRRLERADQHYEHLAVWPFAPEANVLMKVLHAMAETSHVMVCGGDPFMRKFFVSNTVGQHQCENQRQKVAIPFVESSGSDDIRRRLKADLKSCWSTRQRGEWGKGFVLMVEDLNVGLRSAEGDAIAETLRQLCESNTYYEVQDMNRIEVCNGTILASSRSRRNDYDLHFRPFSQRLERHFQCLDIGNIAQDETMFAGAAAFLQRESPANLGAYAEKYVSSLQALLRSFRGIASNTVQNLFMPSLGIQEALRLLATNSLGNHYTIRDIASIVFGDRIPNEQDATNMDEQAKRIANELDLPTHATVRLSAEEDVERTLEEWVWTSGRQLNLSYLQIRSLEPLCIKLKRHWSSPTYQHVTFVIALGNWEAKKAAEICGASENLSVLELNDVNDDTALEPGAKVFFVGESVATKPKQLQNLQAMIEQGYGRAVISVSSETFASLEGLSPQLVCMGKVIGGSITGLKKDKQRLHEVFDQQELWRWLPSPATDEANTLTVDKIAEVCARVSVEVAHYLPYGVTPKNEDIIDEFGQQFVLQYAAQRRALQAQHATLLEGVQRFQEANDEIDQKTSEYSDSTEREDTALKETSSFLQQISSLEAEIQQAKTELHEEEQNLQGMEEELSASKQNVDWELKEAKSQYNMSVERLQRIDKSSLTELKAYVTPPKAIKLLMEALCIVLGESGTWHRAVNMLEGTSEMHLLDRLVHLDVSMVSSEAVNAASKYVYHENFSTDEIWQWSNPAYVLAEWILTMVKLGKALEENRKREMSVSQAESKVENTRTHIEEKRRKLTESQDEYQRLWKAYEEAKQAVEKEKLAKEHLTNEQANLEQLLAELKSPVDEWHRRLARIERELSQCLGNTLLASVIIVFGPALGEVDRLSMRKRAKVILEQESIPTKLDLSLLDFFRQRWPLGFQADRLKAPEHLRESILLAQNAPRLPVLLDVDGECKRLIGELFPDATLEELPSDGTEGSAADEVAATVAATNSLACYDLDAVTDVGAALRSIGSLTGHTQRSRAFAVASDLPALGEDEVKSCVVIMVEAGRSGMQEMAHDVILRRVAPRETVRKQKLEDVRRKDARAFEHAHQKLLSHLAHGEKDLGSDDYLLRSVSSTVEQIAAIISRMNETSSELERLGAVLDKACGHLSMAASSCLKGLDESDMRFGLRQPMVKLLSNVLRPALETALESSPQADAGDGDNAEAASFIRGFAQFLSLRVDADESVAFTTHVACSWLCAKGNASEDERKYLLTSLIKEAGVMSCSVLASRYTLSDLVRSAARLEEEYPTPVFSGLREEVQSRGREWLSWALSYQAFDRPGVPLDTDLGSLPFLALESVMRPHRIREAVDRFLQEALGVTRHPSSVLKPPVTLLEHALQSESREPTVVIHGANENAALACEQAAEASGIDLEYAETVPYALSAIERGAVPVVPRADELDRGGIHLAKRIALKGEHAGKAFLLYRRDSLPRAISNFSAVDIASPGDFISMCARNKAILQCRNRNRDGDAAKLAEVHERMKGHLCSLGLPAPSSAALEEVAHMAKYSRAPFRLANCVYATATGDPQLVRRVAWRLAKAFNGEHTTPSTLVEEIALDSARLAKALPSVGGVTEQKKSVPSEREKMRAVRVAWRAAALERKFRHGHSATELHQAAEAEATKRLARRVQSGENRETVARILLGPALPESSLETCLEELEERACALERGGANKVNRVFSLPRQVTALQIDIKCGVRLEVELSDEAVREPEVALEGAWLDRGCLGGIHEARLSLKRGPSGGDESLPLVRRFDFASQHHTWVAGVGHRFFIL